MDECKVRELNKVYHFLPTYLANRAEYLAKVPYTSNYQVTNIMFVKSFANYERNGVLEFWVCKTVETKREVKHHDIMTSSSGGPSPLPAHPGLGCFIGHI